MYIGAGMQANGHASVVQLYSAAQGRPYHFNPATGMVQVGLHPIYIPSNNAELSATAFPQEVSTITCIQGGQRDCPLKSLCYSESLAKTICTSLNTAYRIILCCSYPPLTSHIRVLSPDTVPWFCQSRTYSCVAALHT